MNLVQQIAVYGSLGAAFIALIAIHLDHRNWRKGSAASAPVAGDPITFDPTRWNGPDRTIGVPEFLSNLGRR